MRIPAPATDRVGLRPKAASPTLPALTGLRGLAAALVAYSHYSGSGRTLGQTGVQFFFVLSAFLMTLLYADAPRGNTFASRAKFAAGFLRNRIARVIPLPVFLTAVSYALRMFPAMSKYPQFIMEDPWWDYVLLRSAMNIQWTIVIELGFYLVFGFLLLFPIHVTKTLLGVLSCVAFHAFMFPGEATLADVTGMHWGILTSRQRPARWFFFGVLLYAMHMALCKYRDRKTRRLDSAPPSRASKALDQATAIAEAAASAAIAGALIVRCAYWQLEVKRFNIWSDSLDVALVLAVLLGSLWLWPIMWALGNPGLQHLGKISYSVYLTHMFVKQFVHDAGLRKMDSIPHFLLFLAWTAAVSTLTFEFVEKPMNKLLRCRWAPSQMPAWADAPEKDVDESWMTGLPKFMSV